MGIQVSEVFRFSPRFRPGMHIFVNYALEAFRTPQHSHDAFEMNYVSEGSGYQYINDRVVPVKRGDLFLLPIGTSHVYRPSTSTEDNSLTVINCVFRLEALPMFQSFPPPGSLLERALYRPSSLPHPWLQFHDKDHVLYDLFLTLLTEYRQASPGYHVIVQSLFHQIVAMLHRMSEQEDTALPGRQKIEEAIRFIRKRYHEDITLKEVAGHNYVSTSHLHKLIKQATGSTFTHYLQNLRIQRSCELLRTTDMTVQHIAEAVGYRDMKFFHRLFRKKTGMTPNEYRKHGVPLLGVGGE
ncbi:AraC family transcriptional regulator [Paenibacillus sp. GD4]|uniref:AraC family transcriptional regulator n=1 Tax=Paenibacillus sp. GD4 TaxID=3068890 RepID=UPI002796766F|nr:AraC family transcriptional regulator [Paenibacillus sp. GD4]MDQ1913490.1 AraC family transcriptional regulator [Paenibacillus sp. GD4]